MHEDQHLNCTGEINFLLPRFRCQILIPVSLPEGFVIISSRSFPLISHLLPFLDPFLRDGQLADPSSPLFRPEIIDLHETRILMPSNWLEEGTSVSFQI